MVKLTFKELISWSNELQGVEYIVQASKARSEVGV